MPTAMPSTPETIGLAAVASASRKSQTSRAALAAHGDGHEIGQVVAGGEGARHAEKHVARMAGSASPAASAADIARIHGAGDGVLLVRPVHADGLDRAARST